MKAFMPALCAIRLVVLPATLQSAIEAHESGDSGHALKEVDDARQRLLALKTDALAALLREAPDGRTREITTERTAALGMMGGGTGARVEYSGDGQSVRPMMMADTPVVGTMSGMIANAAMYGARVERVGHDTSMVQNREVTGLVVHNSLVKASGEDVQTLLDLIGTMDFATVKPFGQGAPLPPAPDQQKERSHV